CPAYAGRNGFPLERGAFATRCPAPSRGGAKREPPHHLRTPPAGSFPAVQHTHTGPVEADARAPAEALQIGPPTGQRVHTVAAVKRAALAGPALQSSKAALVASKGGVEGR